MLIGTLKSTPVFDAILNNDYGFYRIQGTVTRLGVPGSYRVIIFSRQSGMPIRSVWSAADGTYEFNYLRNQTYFAIAFDHSGTLLNAGVGDLITPELMP